MNLFINMIVENPAYYLSWVTVAGFSICVHEYGHARSAFKHGDDTAAMLGHLSLNPLKQMRPISICMLFLIGVAWGAVPVNERNLEGAHARAKVSFAGPFANLLLAAGFSLLFVLAKQYAQHPAAIQVCFIGIVVNGLLFTLNMLPIPLMDGWNVLAAYVEPMRALPRAQLANISWMALLLIILSPAWSWIGQSSRMIAGLFIYASERLLFFL